MDCGWLPLLSQQFSVAFMGPVSLMAANGLPDTLPGVVREKERLLLLGIGGGVAVLLMLFVAVAVAEIVVVVGTLFTDAAAADATTVSMYEELMCSSRWCNQWARELGGGERKSIFRIIGRRKGNQSYDM